MIAPFSYVHMNASNGTHTKTHSHTSHFVFVSNVLIRDKYLYRQQSHFVSCSCCHSYYYYFLCFVAAAVVAMMFKLSIIKPSINYDNDDNVIIIKSFIIVRGWSTSSSSSSSSSTLSFDHLFRLCYNQIESDGFATARYWAIFCVCWFECAVLCCVVCWANTPTEW